MDAGGFGADATKDFERWERTQFVWELMGMLGYDVVTPGDLELVRGIEPLQELYATQPEIQVVSANIQDQNGNRIFPQSTVIERGGIRIGVTGVTSPTHYAYNKKRGIQEIDEFTFEDPREALRRVVPELQAESDIVLALVHEGATETQRIVGDVPGMDVVIAGHNPGYMFNPDRVDETLLIRPGNRGQYLSVLTLTLDEETLDIVDYTGQGVSMGDDVSKDEAIEPLVTRWEADHEKRRNEYKKRQAADAAVTQGLEKYVGAEMCARCHIEEYTRWAETAHAHAFQSLVDSEQETVGECLKCHVVGFGEPTGYEVSISEARKGHPTSTDTPMLRNVQCENCHGMGTFHGTVAMERTPGEETCLSCHTSDFDEDWDYARALETGVH